MKAVGLDTRRGDSVRIGLLAVDQLEVPDGQVIRDFLNTSIDELRDYIKALLSEDIDPNLTVVEQLIVKEPVFSGFEISRSSKRTGQNRKLIGPLGMMRRISLAPQFNRLTIENIAKLGDVPVANNSNDLPGSIIQHKLQLPVPSSKTASGYELFRLHGREALSENGFDVAEPLGLPRGVDQSVLDMVDVIADAVLLSTLKSDK